MAKSLGGSTFIYNGISQDYCFLETLDCLYELCDEISVVHGGTDDTTKLIHEWIDSKSWVNKKIHDCPIFQREWEAQKGREKLSYFSNLAIDMLSTDWNIYLQCDEILHERSFPYVREAIEHDIDSYLMKRYNMWRDAVSHLVVEQARKPCSTEVIRLARTEYRCFNDAESIMAPFTHYLHIPDKPKGFEPMEIYHVGFIRDEVKHVVKAKNVLVDIFGMEMDRRFGNKFDYRNFPFTDDDIQPVPLPVPKFIKQWLMVRHPDCADQLS